MKIDCAGIVRIAACACAALVLTGAVLKSSVARAAWPDHTITIIVPFPPGGPNDLLGRLLAAELAPKLGQSVIVENRAGAVGNIGIAAAARAAPDGYALLVVTGVVLINPSVTKVAYDPLKDFVPVAYLGAAPSLQAALAGTTDIACVSIAGLIGHIRSGSLIALAQTGAERWIDMPDVPTMQEAGIPNAVVETSQMMLAPAGTPAPVLARLAEATHAILAKPDIREKMLAAGFLVKYEGP